MVEYRVSVKISAKPSKQIEFNFYPVEGVTHHKDIEDQSQFRKEMRKEIREHVDTDGFYDKLSSDSPHEFVINLGTIEVTENSTGEDEIERMDIITTADSINEDNIKKLHRL